MGSLICKIAQWLEKKFCQKELASMKVYQNADVSSTGSELQTNGTFDSNITGWANYQNIYDTFEFDTGQLHAVETGGGNGVGYGPTFAVEKGKTYAVVFKITKTSGSDPTVGLITSVPSGYMNGTSWSGLGTGTYTYYIVAPGDSSGIRFQFTNTGNTEWHLDDVSVKEVTSANLPATGLQKIVGIVWASDQANGRAIDADNDFLLEDSNGDRIIGKRAEADGDGLEIFCRSLLVNGIISALQEGGVLYVWVK